MESVTVKELIDAGVHFGCPVSRWNPKMAPYIYGRRNLIHVMDLRKTLRGILRAQNFLYHVAAEGQQILWVGAKRQIKGVIQDAGQRTGMPVVTERWIGGTLTNFSVIRSRLRRLEELETMEEDGTMASHSKKMVSNLRRERKKIERNLGGIREMSTIPGAMCVVDPGREVNAVREARRMGVPVIGILDTDCDPSLVDIVIPGNDDALKSVRLILDRLISSVEEGGAHRQEHAPVVKDEDKKGDLLPSDEPRPTRGRTTADLKKLRPTPDGEAAAPVAATPSTDGEPAAPEASEVPAPTDAPAEPAPAKPAIEASVEPDAEVAAKAPTGDVASE
jgi:small subunit ribosomal protein S2